jgi:hypothetical protein
LHKETFDRLTRLRQFDVPKKPADHLKRHKHIPNISLDEQLPEIPPSGVTKRILENSEVGKLSLRERETKSWRSAEQNGFGSLRKRKSGATSGMKRCSQCRR